MGAQLPAAAHSSTGRPSYQHDRHLIHHTATASLFAVADGHGSPKHGHQVSHHIVTTFPQLLQTHNALAPSPDLPSRLRTAVASLDASSIALTSAARVYAGSTLCAVLRIGQALFCTNVGDSRALVVPASGDPRQLSVDHVCTHPVEKARIENAGGVVVGGLLNGYISMSRAIGDDDLKAHRNLTPFPFNRGKTFGENLFTGDADVTHDKVCDEDVVTVIASDGVWGSLSNADVAAVVRQQIRKGRSAQEVAKAVVKKAIQKGSKDNVTAVIGFLREEATARILVNAKRRRRLRRGVPITGNALNTPKDVSTEDELETTTSSESNLANSSDRVLMDRSRPYATDLPRFRTVGGESNTPKPTRFRWRTRNLSSLN